MKIAQFFFAFLFFFCVSGISGQGFMAPANAAGSSKSEVASPPIQLVKSPAGTLADENLLTAIQKVARDSIPAVVQIVVTERKEIANPFLPFEGNPFWQNFFNLPKKMPKKFKEELQGLGSGMHC